MKKIWLVFLLFFSQSWADEHLHSSTSLSLLTSIAVASSFFTGINQDLPKNTILQCGCLSNLLACFGITSASRPSSRTGLLSAPSVRSASGYKVIAGDQEPPPSGNQKMARNAFDNAIKEMRRCLKSISELLKKKMAGKLIIVTDLDQTFFRESLKINLFSFFHHDALELQKHWYWDFSEFLEENNRKVLLIYNTARSCNHITHRADPVSGISSQGTGSVNINMQLRVSSRSQGHRDMMSFLYSGDPKIDERIGIPVPDVLIAGGGAYIQLGSSLRSVIPDIEVKKLNKGLEEFRKRELTVINNILAKVRQYNSIDMESPVFEISTNNELTHVLIVANVRRLSREAFRGFTYPHSSGSVPVFKFFQDGVKLVNIFNAAVNKGSTLRLVNHMLACHADELGLNLDSAHNPIMEVIFGDSLADVPMVRKDLEIRGVSEEVSEAAMSAIEEKFEELLPGITGTSRELWWFFSGVPNKSLIHQHDPALEAKLNHPRILEYGQQGLLGIMQRIEEKLEQCQDL